MSVNIAVVGTGYVGLTTGTCLAHLGNDVTCIDVDETKVERLRRADVPIHEPGLPELVAEGISRDGLRFTSDVVGGVAGRQVDRSRTVRCR
jgi:UDPglucose 6-dehydrogenase